MNILCIPFLFLFHFIYDQTSQNIPTFLDFINFINSLIKIEKCYNFIHTYIYFHFFCLFVFYGKVFYFTRSKQCVHDDLRLPIYPSLTSSLVTTSSSSKFVSLLLVFK